MARKPYVIIDSEILSSTVWSEPPHVKLVWLTLLILCDTEGYVGAAVPGIANAAGVTLQEAEDAISRLQQPDRHSRTKTHDGVRLAVAERGFQILNFVEHLERLSAERKKARDRVRRFRARKRSKADSNVTVAQGVGNREEGIGNREPTNVGREVTAPPRLPADRAELATTNEIRRLQNELGARIARLSEHPSSTDMVPTWCRRVTSYKNSKGVDVSGVPDYRTVLSIDRLEKSIADADWWLSKLDKEQAGGAS